MTKRVATLLTVFNRKEKTLKCLQNLYAQLPIEGYEVDVYLTDDGCTDGTPEAVAEQFPEVHIIQGDGTLFWNRGMYTAWVEAAKGDYDFYLWLNDDVALLDGAISTILNESSQKQDRSVIVGSMRASQSETITYGGRFKKKKVTPNGELQLCDTMNGNVVLVPQAVYNKVGNLDWRYSHSLGDLDYGYRVRKAGLEIYTSANYAGMCDANVSKPKWTRSDVSLLDRLKNLYSPLSYSDPREYFYYESRNISLSLAIMHMFTIHLHVLCPKLWKHK